MRGRSGAARRQLGPERGMFGYGPHAFSFAIQRHAAVCGVRLARIARLGRV